MVVAQVSVIRIRAVLEAEGRGDGLWWMMLFQQRARGGTGLAAGWRVEGRMVGGERSTPASQATMYLPQEQGSRPCLASFQTLGLFGLCDSDPGSSRPLVPL